MSEENDNIFNRFSGLVDLEKISQIKVCQIGAGGIGVPTAISLAKMGVRHMQVWDFDKVEKPNMGTQLYGPDHEDEYKAIALKQHIEKQAPWCEFDAKPEKFESGTFFTDFDVVIAAVDSLEVRRLIFNAMLRRPKENQLLIDPRMGAEVITCFSVLPTEDKSWYPETFEGEAVEAPCTEKATFYTGFAAGSLALSMFTQWLRGERDIVEITFDLRYTSLLTMNLEQKKKMVRE